MSEKLPPRGSVGEDKVDNHVQHPHVSRKKTKNE